MSSTPSAITRLLPSAVAGDGQAQFRLAVLYRNDGNPVEARKWARLSAWAGVIEAQLLLAGFLSRENHSGEEQSTCELWRAALLYYRAMKQGNETGNVRLRELLERMAGEWHDAGDVKEFEETLAIREKEMTFSPSTELGWQFESEYLAGTPWRIISSLALPDGAIALELGFRPSAPVPCPLCDSITEESSVSNFHWCFDEFSFLCRTDTWVDEDRQWEPMNSKVVLAGVLPHFECQKHGAFPAPMPWTRKKPNCRSCFVTPISLL